MPTLDLEFIRSQFPAFSEPSLEGWAHFENAGGSYPCKQVVDRLTHFYTKTKIQPYGISPIQAEAGAAMDEAYTRLAAYLNVGEDEVHFGPSTSQNPSSSKVLRIDLTIFVRSKNVCVTPSLNAKSAYRIRWRSSALVSPACLSGGGSSILV